MLWNFLKYSIWKQKFSNQDTKCCQCKVGLYRYFWAAQVLGCYSLPESRFSFLWKWQYSELLTGWEGGILTLCSTFLKMRNVAISRNLKVLNFRVLKKHKLSILKIPRQKKILKYSHHNNKKDTYVDKGNFDFVSRSSNML